MALILTRNFLWPLLQSHMTFPLAIIDGAPTTLQIYHRREPASVFNFADTQTRRVYMQ